MANTQWLDRSQPQTLYMANVLLYFNVVWWVIYLSVFSILALPALFAGLGIANEKRIGYVGAVAVAAVNLLMILDLLAAGGQSLGVIINLMFGAALLALLLHPMSRSYQRIWFRKLNRR